MLRPLGPQALGLVLASCSLIAPHQWHHLVLEIDPTGGSASLTVDGVKRTQSFAPVVAGSSNLVTDVYAGLQGELQPSPELRVLFDDVAIDRF